MWKKIRNPWHYGAGFCDWMLVDDFSICLRVPIAKSWFFGVQSPVLLLWVCLKIIGKNKFPWLIRCLIFQHGGKVLSNFPHSNCNFILYIYKYISWHTPCLFDFIHSFLDYFWHVNPFCKSHELHLRWSTHRLSHVASNLFRSDTDTSSVILHPKKKIYIYIHIII